MGELHLDQLGEIGKVPGIADMSPQIHSAASGIVGVSTSLTAFVISTHPGIF
jgi:hypothetical protein